MHTIQTTQEQNQGPAFLQTPAQGFTVDHAAISQIVKAMAATYESASICLETEGLTYRSMDSSHVLLTDMRIPQNCFEKYNITGETFATFNPKELKRVLQTLDKNLSIAFSLETDKIKISQGQTVIHIEASFERPCDCPIPRLPYDAVITFRDAKQFKDILKQCELVGDYVEIVATEGQVLFKALINGETQATITKYKQELKDLSVRYDSSTTYSIEYLKTFLASVPTKNDLTLDFSERKPLRARTLVSVQGVIEFYLAPRVES